MHVALLANLAWLDDELPGFQHLVVGLIDEQVRVAQVVPQQVPLDESSVFGERVPWLESPWPLLNRYRLSRLDRGLEELGVGLLHALDGRLWTGAAALADRMSVPVVLTANSHLDLKLVTRLGRSIKPTHAAFTATTEPIAQAVRDRLDPAFIVEMIPTGAHPGQPVRQRQPGDAMCAVVTGRGNLDEKYHALLEGLAEFVRQYPQTQFFFDGQGSDQHQIWQAAQHLGLLSNMSLIPRRLGHRELLLRADVLLQPQPAGRSRGLTLQAMAHAVPVVAHEDPWVDYLIHDETAWVLADADAQAWHGYLRRLADEPQTGQQLGERAQAWIRRHRLASQQIARTLDLYRRLTGETIKFPVE